MANDALAEAAQPTASNPPSAASARIQRQTARRQRLERLLDASAALSGLQDPDRILHTAAQALASAFDLDACQPALYDPERDALQAQPAVGPRGDPVAREALPGLLSLPAARRALETQQPRLVRRDDPATAPAEAAWLQERGLRAVLLLPLVAWEQTLGLLAGLVTSAAGKLTPADLDLAQALARQTAVALDHARFRTAAQHQLQQQAALREAATAIASALDLDTVLARIAQEMVRALDVSGAVICGYSAHTEGAPVLAEYVDPQSCPWSGIPDEADGPASAHSGFLDQLRTGGHAVAHAEDPHLPPSEEARLRRYCAQTILYVPLRAKDRLLGYAELFEQRRRRHFSAAEVALAHDLAQQAAIALENARLYEQAQQEIADRRRAQHALRERNQELDAFAHTVAHDLKNPLSFVIGMAEVLAAGLDDLSAEQVERYLRTIADRGRKMNAIVDALLLLALVREAEVDFQPLDTGAIVDEALHRLEPLVDDLSAQVTRPAYWPAALGYAPWVEEVWVNYLSNALTYGGRPPQIELGGERLDESTVRFWVQDHGPGLTPDQQVHLFVPFAQWQRGHSATHGLGLSIVRRIVLKLDGQVGVDSAGVPGQGCRFWFTLPAPPPAGKE